MAPKIFELVQSERGKYAVYGVDINGYQSANGSLTSAQEQILELAKNFGWRAICFEVSHPERTRTRHTLGSMLGLNTAFKSDSLEVAFVSGDGRITDQVESTGLDNVLTLYETRADFLSQYR